MSRNGVVAGGGTRSSFGFFDRSLVGGNAAGLVP